MVLDNLKSSRTWLSVGCYVSWLYGDCDKVLTLQQFKSKI